MYNESSGSSQQSTDTCRHIINNSTANTTYFNKTITRLAIGDIAMVPDPALMILLVLGVDGRCVDQRGSPMWLLSVATIAHNIVCDDLWWWWWWWWWWDFAVTRAWAVGGEMWAWALVFPPKQCPSVESQRKHSDSSHKTQQPFLGRWFV